MSSRDEAPARWDRTTVGGLGEVVTGNTPPTANAANYGGDIPFVSPASLDGRRWIEGGISTLSEEGADLARVLPPKAVLVTCIGILGKVGQSKNAVATNQQINAVVARSHVDPHFLFHAANRFSAAMKRIAGLQVLPIVNKSQFSRVPVLLPPSPSSAASPKSSTPSTTSSARPSNSSPSSSG